MSVARALRSAAGPAFTAGAVALLLTGWSGVPADAGPAPASEPPAASVDTTVVGMTNSLEFTPRKVTIRAGETVLWKNTSVLVHTVTAIADSAADPAHVASPEGAEPFGSGRLGPGESYRRTFTVPGTYRYVCIPHEAAGMVGTVVVEADP